MWVINKVMLGCDKASFLVSKKEESKLTMKESIQLKLHLLACKMCRHFEEQSNHIHEKVEASMKKDVNEGALTMMDETSKTTLREIMDSNINQKSSK